MGACCIRRAGWCRASPRTLEGRQTRGHSLHDFARRSTRLGHRAIVAAIANGAHMRPDAPAMEILAELWAHAGGDRQALDYVALRGREPALPSSFRVGAIAQATIAAAGLAAAA